MEYDISNLTYPIRYTFKGDKIILKNYVIEVDNNRLVNEYLKNYTQKGKKKMASCEKDKEIIIRHIETDYIISKQLSIDAVYLIYALQYKTKFLNWGSVTEELIKIFEEEVEEDEYNALRNLVLYLKYYWQYEEQISKIVIREKQQDSRIVIGYDSYFLALDIMDGELQYAYDNCMFYLPFRLLSKIWKVYCSYVNF